MSTLLRIIAWCVLVLSGFGIGAITAVVRGWGSPVVTLELANQSGRSIQSFVVRYDTCGNKASITSEGPSAGQSKRIYFSVCGEGGYALEVVFSDGQRMVSRNSYVESGYSITEVVTANTIDSKQPIYGL
ncbi:hypothetical protein [Oryzomicrobium sp.]|uniref:hypothetical protein n=1 Tax=Oryzomicrobium sp. TaxID=1911578 RepID=UPI0025CE22E2|nr:hypothetical protein [Oryzomicrobium sp.]MCE1242837.1 hypothetical protein [Oryzomicrobium sp.]